MPELPPDLADALRSEEVNGRFELLQQDVRENFSWWVETAGSPDKRRIRIERIVSAVKEIQAELNQASNDSPSS